jgi:hypothetical protein
VSLSLFLSLSLSPPLCLFSDPPPQSLFLMGTPNPQPSFFLIAAAMRLAHSIGLHKKFSAFGLNPSEVEQRKRVFWIAYMLDKECVALQFDFFFVC